MEEQLRSNLIELARLYEGSTGVSARTISKRALNDNRFLVRLESAAAGFNVRSYDRLVAWLSENWPSDLAWPAHVSRPGRDKSRMAA